MNFASLLSRAASNDPSLVELEIKSWTLRIPENRAELVKLVVAALATNTHVKSFKITSLGLTEADIVPLAELLKTRDFEWLDLGGNNLTGEILFPALAVRKSVRVLRLSGNRALIAREHLSAINSLKELDLSLCKLPAVPPAVLQMLNLEVLNLSKNPLKTLPASFASLISLKQLDVSGCEFSEFPAVLLSPTNLEKLNISYNDITEIPEGISALVNLKSFVAYRCGLIPFPISVTRLAQLEELGLSGNRGMQRVPNDIGNLRNLKVLSLSECGLMELPAALWTLAHLETLDLHSNRLAWLPGAIAALCKLKKLVLSDSLINRLPSELQQLSLLEFLDISSTELTYLPVWLTALWLLKELKCSCCPVVGVALDDRTHVTFDELAGLVSNSRDPEEIRKQKRSLEGMIDRKPLRLLRFANMHCFAPRTLRVLCVSKCVAQHSRLEMAGLPAHLRDEIMRVAGVGEQERQQQ